MTLGINCEGVLLMHPEKKTVLENYQFTVHLTAGGEGLPKTGRYSDHTSKAHKMVGIKMKYITWFQGFWW